MTKTLNKEYSLTETEGHDIVIKSMFENSFSFSEANKEFRNHQQKISEMKAKLKQIKEYITKQGWEEQLANISQALNDEEEVLELFRKALKPYFDSREEEGLKEVRKRKREAKYDRLGKEQKGKAMARIVAEVTAILGLDDIDHPVMQSIRKSFDEVK